MLCTDGCCDTRLLDMLGNQHERNAKATDEENRAASEPNGDREKGDNREGELLARER